jgi:twitching motility two-component system response regulator PilH
MIQQLQKIVRLLGLMQSIAKNCPDPLPCKAAHTYSPGHRLRQTPPNARSKFLSLETFMPISRILCVDDASPDLMNIERILSGAGFAVSTAGNGNEAVAKAKSEKPDLIFMDVNMPGMDGFQATRSLSDDAATKLIPVVLVTSKNQKADRIWAQMLGVRGYITKPYTPDQILDTVKACA